MSFLAKLFLDGKTYELLDCEFDFGQKLDSISLPIQRPKSRYIRFTVESSSDNAFLSWMIAPNETRDGEFIFYRRDGMSRMRGIKFEKAYCIGYDEKFRANGVMPLQVTITLSCLKMDFGGAVYKSTAFIETNHMKPYVPPAEVPKEEVTKIRLVSPLHEGANNDGRPKSTQMGFVHGESYLIEVAAFRLGGERVQKSDVKWEYAYTKPSTNDNDEPEVVICKMKETGFRVTFEADNLDMCGTNITFYAYIEKKSAELKEFHHNRFRWFDRSVIENEVEERREKPHLANQSNTPLCGMAAIMYILAKRDFPSYKSFILELHRCGVAKINNYSIDVSSSAHLPDMNPPKNPNYPKKFGKSMPYCDWISFSCIKDKENLLMDYNGANDWEFKAITLPAEMERLMQQILNFKTTKNDTNLVFTKNTELLGEGQSRQIAEIQQLYAEGYEVVLFVNTEMLEKRQSGIISTVEHWVVFGGSFNDPLKHNSHIFKVFTWGRIIDLELSANSRSFNSNYYGYVYGK